MARFFGKNQNILFTFVYVKIQNFTTLKNNLQIML